MSDLDEAVEEAMVEGYGDEEPPKKKKKKKHFATDGIDPTAIPAGHTRDETLKAIADDLAEKGDAEMDAHERFRLDPSQFVIENEIGAKATSLDVSQADPARAYCWARFKAEHGVSQADHKRSLTINVREIATGKTWKEQIWRVVEGKDKEAWELRQPDGTRRLGDVILLWAKREVYEAVVRVAEEKRRELYGATSRAAQAFQEKTGIKVMTEAEMASDPRFEKAAKHAEGFRTANLQEQRRVQQQLLDQQAREREAARRSRA